ncbi:histidine phosphatase family protein [Vasconcelosia minhoensis]|nr:histidine phosphatase family protein [Romeria gracilis]
MILVRHGQSSFNVKRMIQGHDDQSVLTELGEQQARRVGAALSGIVPDAIYASPLKRARRTAELIAETLRQQQPKFPEPQFSDDLKEISLPLWEALTFTDVEAQFPEQYRAWRQQPENLIMSVAQTDGSAADFYPVRAIWAQAARFWQELLTEHRGQTVITVAHSAINRALIGSALALGPESLNRLYQANCAISVLNFAGGWGDAVQLESMNLTGHMDSPLPPLRTGFQGPRLLLVRHGETDWNRDQRFQGQIDVPLNPTGQEQAARAADFLKEIPIHAAVSSSMLRPKQTAEKILAFHPKVSLARSQALWEISHGAWEGKFEADIEAAYPGLLSQWQTAPETVQMPEGENLQQVWQRAIAAWQDIVAAHSGGDQPQTVLVVAHDAINKAILCHVTGLGPEHFWQFKQGNGAVSVIDYPAGANSVPMLSAANITMHLSGSILDKTAAGAL